MKIKFKKFEKVKSVPKDIPKSHNDDRHESHGQGRIPTRKAVGKPVTVGIPLYQRGSG